MLGIVVRRGEGENVVIIGVGGGKDDNVDEKEDNVVGMGVTGADVEGTKLEKNVGFTVVGGIVIDGGLGKYVKICGGRTGFGGD